MNVSGLNHMFEMLKLFHFEVVDIDNDIVVAAVAAAAGLPC